VFNTTRFMMVGGLQYWGPPTWTPVLDTGVLESPVLELKRLFFLELSMVDRLLNDHLRRIYLHLKAPRFDLHRSAHLSPAPGGCTAAGSVPVPGEGAVGEGPVAGEWSVGVCTRSVYQ
jgi:hypothetical protein